MTELAKSTEYPNSFDEVELGDVVMFELNHSSVEKGQAVAICTGVYKFERSPAIKIFSHGELSERPVRIVGKIAIETVTQL